MAEKLESLTRRYRSGGSSSDAGAATDVTYQQVRRNTDK
jgi:hypothetical protein